MSNVIQDPEMGSTGAAASERIPPRDKPEQTEAVEITDRCTPEFLEELTPASGIGAFSRYSPQAADRQHTALITVATLAYGRVLVAHQGRHLVAYLTFHAPEGDCRWAALPYGKILELGGIEVARGFRHMGLAKRLMDEAFTSPEFDDAIVYAQALTWCWDLEGTGMSMAEYREMMLRLFTAYGFKSYLTDEPNIRYHRANILLARIGARTPPALAEEFHAILIKGGEG